MKNIDNTANSRNHGIDIMKILMIFYVCIIHIINQGGAQENAVDNKSTFILLIIMKAISVCAVNGFAVISGYLCYDSKYRISKIVRLYITVMVYNIIIPLTIYNSYRDSFMIDINLDFKSFILNALFPVIYHTNWYFSAYFIMFFMIPFMNTAIKNIDKKQEIQFLGYLFLFICFLHHTVSLLTKTKLIDSYGMDFGYSTMWLCLMYIAGATIKKHEPFKTINKWLFLLLYVLATSVSAAITILMYHFNNKSENMLEYTSPLTVIQALSLLLFFSRIKVPVPIQKIAIFIVPHVFSIYIIHTQKYSWDYIIHILYERIGELNPASAFISLLGNACIIFGICLLIDYPVQKIIDYISFPIQKLYSKRIKDST